jgi:hypothetical protein
MHGHAAAPHDARRRRRWARAPWTASLALLAWLLPSPASAQSWSTDARFGVGTGFEGGNPGTGSVAWHRARTRAVFGLDLVADEAAYSALGFRGFVELEHNLSLGGDLRYVRWVTPGLGLFAGFAGVLAPKYLLGADAGATFVIPLGKKLDLFLEPELSAFPLGSDLPDGSIVVWALLNAGIGFHL